MNNFSLFNCEFAQGWSLVGLGKIIEQSWEPLYLRRQLVDGGERGGIGLNKAAYTAEQAGAGAVMPKNPEKSEMITDGPTDVVN